MVLHKKTVEHQPGISRLESSSDGSTPAPSRAPTTGAQAVGAVAVGALAIGAIALGALAIGRLAIGRARIRRLEIDELVVRKLRVIDSVETPNAPGTGSDTAPDC